MHEVLGRCALNRALLARQLLLERSSMPARDAVGQLLGLQAQAQEPPYFGLWSRLEGFAPAELSELLTTREVVRLALMRSTIHLVTAEDCRFLRPLVEPVIVRATLGTYGKQLAGLDHDELAAAGRALVEAEPLTFAALGQRLAETWPDRDPHAMAMLVRARVALVQPPPRGVWGAGGAARHAPAEQWLGRPLDDEASLDELFRRYLAAFGPASVADVQKWSGLTRLAAVAARLRPQLAVFADEHGRELLDLPDAPRPDPDTPAPVRFVAEFDNLLLSHADRTRVLDEEHRSGVFTVNGRIFGTVLVDGFVAGIWKVERDGTAATLAVTSFVRLARAVRAELVAEGERLLAFAAPEATDATVRIALRA